MGYNIIDLFPPYESKKDFNDKLKATLEHFQEYDRQDYTSDEVVFVATIDRYLDILEKARSMLLKNKFTVEYTGPKSNDCHKLEDFKVIPVQLKENSG